MLRDETLIIKFLPAGGLAAGAIMACEVTTLEHKPWNKSVTAGNFITKSFLPTAQEHESFLLPLELCLQTAQKRWPEGSPWTSMSEEHSGVDHSSLALTAVSAKPNILHSLIQIACPP